MVPFALLCFSESEGVGRRRLFREYKIGFFFFFGFYLVCYSWFLSMYPLSVTGMPAAAALGVVLLALMGISFFQSLGFAVILPIFRAALRRGLYRGVLPIFMGALWCIGEWLQNFFWFGLPWVRLALGQVENPALFRSANLFGSYFVTFLIVSVNFYIALTIMAGQKKKRMAFSFAAALIFLLNGIYGMLDLHISSEKTRETVRISALQGNISTEEKWSDYMLESTFEIYERLCAKASEAGADYALFPETVFPYVAEFDPDIDFALRKWAYKYDMTLMVGTFGDTEEGTSNIIRVYEPSKDGINVYSKQRPVPFGEYVPMRDVIMTVLPILGEINMLNRSLVPGEGSSVWQSSDGSFGHLICFDSIYDSAARESARNGAEALMISTNDSWFGDSVGTRMHSAQAILRAVENGRSVVRAANTGISSVISPEGEIKEFIECDIAGQITADIELSKELTLYTRIGNIFVYICIVFTIVCLLPRKFWNKITVRSS